jgi:single-strand DNA-binding protein
MAGTLNKVILIGRLGRDPEIRHASSGQDYAILSLATDEHYVDKEGQRVEKTEWHRVVVWGKQVQFVSNYLVKGSLVFTEGKIESRKWQDKSGMDRYITEIKVDKIIGLNNKKDDVSAHPNNISYTSSDVDNKIVRESTSAFPNQSSLMDDFPF